MVRSFGSAIFALPLLCFGLSPASAALPARMVIVTQAAQAPEYQRLADFKNAVGVPTEVHLLSDIAIQYPAPDLAAGIRQFLQAEAAGGSLEYVLLGGGGSVVPYRNAHTEFFEGKEIPTDLYYSDLDGDWDADGDGVYGEPTDNVDLVPDVHVGRIPSVTAGQARDVVDKILAYLQGPASSSPAPERARIRYP